MENNSSGKLADTSVEINWARKTTKDKKLTWAQKLSWQSLTA